MPPGTLERRILTALCAAALLGLAALAWQAMGWFGVGVLGLLVLFIAVRVDLEGDRPVGHQMTPGLYAGQYRDEMQARTDDMATRRAQRLSVATSARLAMLLGALLTTIGFGLFFIL